MAKKKKNQSQKGQSGKGPPPKAGVVARALRAIQLFVVETVTCWFGDNAPRMAAALAFYTTFSLGPALLIGLGVAGMFVGESTAKSELIDKLQGLITPQAADYAVTVLDSLLKELTGRRLPLVGVLSALVAGSAMFMEVQSSLNTIWEAVPREGNNILKAVYTRAASFAFVLGLGILLMLSVVTTTVLSGLNAFFSKTLAVPEQLIAWTNLVISFAVLPVVLAVAYRVIPDTEIQWKDVWLGAVVASLLFTAGKALFGMYLRLSFLGSVYGAAGSLVVLLFWVYYSAQVFFLGAEITKVYARRYGSRADS